MTPIPDLDAFLERSFTASIATQRADGFPHQVPVWYRWDGQAVLIWTQENRAWFRNLARDDRVSIAMFESGPTWAASIIRGRAASRTGTDPETIAECRRITERYVPPGEVDTVLERWVDGPQTIVRVEPVSVTTWTDPSG